MKKVGVNGKLFQVPVDSQWGPTTVNALKKFQTLEKILVSGAGQQIPLTELAKIEYVRGPQVIKSEDTSLIG